MSQPGPYANSLTGSNTNLSEEKIVQDLPPPNGPPQGPQSLLNQQRPQLNRIDSRTNFQPQYRPQFPNSQPPGPLPRPPQIRPGPQSPLGPQPPQNPQNPQNPQVQFPPRPPQQLQRPLGPPGAPGVGFPQPRPGFRPGVPFQRPPGVPQGQPQGQGQGQPRGQLFQQKSHPAFGQQRPVFAEELLNRSQTLDSSEIDNQRYEETKINADNQRNSNIIQRSPSTELRTEERKDSKHGSNESLDRKSDNEVPSRPESRSMLRMDKIIEDEGKKKQNITIDYNKQNVIEPNKQNIVDQNVTKHNVVSDQNISRQNVVEPIKQNENHYNNEITISKPPVANHNENKVEQESRTVQEAPKSNQEPRNFQEQKKYLDLGKPPIARSPARSEGDNDSGVDESTQGNDPSSNGDGRSPRKSSKSRTNSTTPTKGRSQSRGSKTPSLQSPDSNATTPGSTEKKKVPMNKVQVGAAPSPNLKVVRSKIGSLDNAKWKPGGGHVKIESKKLDFKNASSRIEAKNDKYIPKTGEKKIVQQKLQWNAKSKIGSLDNATYKPKGGDKKIESIKLDFKDKAKSKVGSKDNIKHTPGGGDVKIESKKIELHAQSKIGSLDNVKHKPKGGDKKIFDDKDYLKQRSTTSVNQSLSGSQMRHVQLSDEDEYMEYEEPQSLQGGFDGSRRILNTLDEELTSGFRRTASARYPRRSASGFQRPTSGSVRRTGSRSARDEEDNKPRWRF